MFIEFVVKVISELSNVIFADSVSFSSGGSNKRPSKKENQESVIDLNTNQNIYENGVIVKV